MAIPMSRLRPAPFGQCSPRSVEGAGFKDRHGKRAGEACGNQRRYGECDHVPPQEMRDRARQIEQDVIAEGE